MVGDSDFRSHPKRAVLLCLGLLIPSFGHAAPESPKHPVLVGTEKAATHFQKGEFASAVAELEKALAKARAAAPLEIRKAIVVHEPHTGLGIYEPAPRNQVLNRELRLYVEVAGFTYRKLAAPTGDEKFQTELNVTGTFFMDGVPLGERSLGSHMFITRTPTGMTSFGVEALLGPKAPAGAYEIILRVSDANSNKSAAYRTHFVITP